MADQTKADVQRDMLVAEWERRAEWPLAGVAVAFLIAYAVGQFVCGMLGDRFGTRRVLLVGMLASVVTFSNCTTTRLRSVNGLRGPPRPAFRLHRPSGRTTCLAPRRGR